MPYRPLPYDPFYPHPPARGIGIPMDPDVWMRPAPGTFPPPFFDGYASRGGGWDDRGCFPDFRPSDMRDFARGGALNPQDFATPGPGAGPASPGPYIDPLPTQLDCCARGLKSVADRLNDASSDEDRQAAALDGLQTVGYLMGVLTMAGMSLPSALMASGGSAPTGVARGTACREAGDWVDRMLEKYSGRGAGADIGEGLDRVGACVRELRDNFGR